MYTARAHWWDRGNSLANADLFCFPEKPILLFLKSTLDSFKVSDSFAVGDQVGGRDALAKDSVHGSSEGPVRALGGRTFKVDRVLLATAGLG